VDGTSADAADNAGVDRLNAALYPDAANAQHSFVFTRTSGATLTRQLTSAAVTKTPVPIARVVTTPQGQRAGYLLFNDHIAPAEAQLITAMRGFQARRARAGAGHALQRRRLPLHRQRAGDHDRRQHAHRRQAFETLKFSAKRSGENEMTPFFNTSCILVGNRCTQQQPCRC
jgi:hypothetical protein